MAKNWTLKEATEKIIIENDLAAMQELGSRFPLASIAIAKMGTNSDAMMLFGAIPDIVTILKIEKALKEGVTADDAEDQEVEEIEPKAAAVEKEEPEDNGVFSDMSLKELIALCDKHNIAVARAGKPKPYYIAKLTDAGVLPEDEVELDAAEEQEELEIINYDRMTAVELYKLCKERKIEVKPKQKAVVYAELLKEYDAANENSDDDGWDDDPDTEAAGSKSAANDDEEWDI